MRALVLIDGFDFPASYLEMGFIRLENFDTSDMLFDCILLVDWDAARARATRYKWIAKVESVVLKVSDKPSTAVDLHLNGYWSLQGVQPELRNLVGPIFGVRTFTNIEASIWDDLGKSTQLPPSIEPTFLSIRDASRRLALSYGVPESAVKIAITN